MTPPARILMTADAVGGVWTYAVDLARTLCARGHEIVLVTMGPAPRAEQLEPLRGISGLSIEITDLALEWMDPEGRDMRAASVLLPIAERTRPQVAHLNGFREAALPWPVPVVVVAHSCVWTWWEACRGTEPDEPRWHRYADRVATGLRAAEAWVAPTEALRGAIETRYRPETPGSVIRNGTDLPACVNAKEPVILAAGRLWDEAKNLVVLEKIAAGLDWAVQAAGPMPEPDRTAVRGIAPLGLLPRPEMIRAMQRASIFVSPALYEPFGLSVLEAAACGCALVLSDIASFRELWVGAALFVDPHDPEALAATLQRLSREDALRVRMQQAARRRSHRYRLDTMAAGYERLYASLLNPTMARPAARAPSTECRA